ncbi:MAG: hypothetical protein OEX12_01640 [Gammaproteobacteria bacterium]|nr:hypothetical protein [Gammaproteobacteria bacterium]
MRYLYLLFVLLLNTPLWAQESLQLSHTVVDVEQTSTGARINYRLNLANSGTHDFRDIHLVLHDVSLSLTDVSGSLDIHALSSGHHKYRFLNVESALSGAQQLQSEDLLFHLQAVDEQGQLYSTLIRSKGVSQ